MSVKDDLLQELNKVLALQEEMAKRVEIVKTKILEEENKKVFWTPTHGQQYYYINNEVIVLGCPYDNNWRSDKVRIKNLNYYETEKKCERAIFEQILNRKLNKFAHENNEEEIDWSNPVQAKYMIIYDNDSKKLEASIYSHIQSFGQVYFTSKEIAERAIKNFKDDLIRSFTTKE
jgi:hypothetical protein